MLEALLNPYDVIILGSSVSSYFSRTNPIREG